MSPLKIFSRQSTFFSAENTRKNAVSVWAYCLMGNHVHIVARLWGIHVESTQDAFTFARDGEVVGAVRYVERNPVRAGMVNYAEEYQWSSAKAHVFHLDDHYLSGEERVIIAIDDWKLYLMSPDDENHLKELRMGARTGRPIGNDSFLDKLELLTGKIFRKQKPGPKPRN